MTGGFITLEGGDGSGKTTHLDFIAEWLRERGAQVTRTREPGGTALGEQLRELLLGGDAAPRSARAELLLLFAARAQHLDEVIVPALNAGDWVLSDRFTDATYAYQGGGRGIDPAAIETLERWTHGELQPDLTVLLDVPVALGIARARQRALPSDSADTPDRFERQPTDFKEAVRRAYLARAREMPARIKCVDARGDIGQVRAELAAVLDAFWAERAV